MIQNKAGTSDIIVVSAMTPMIQNKAVTDDIMMTSTITPTNPNDPGFDDITMSFKTTHMTKPKTKDGKAHKIQSSKIKYAKLHTNKSIKAKSLCSEGKTAI